MFGYVLFMRNKRAYIWGLCSKIVPSAIQLIANMILARLLSPSDFGTIGVLTIIFTLANVLVDSGLGGSLIKEELISKRDCSTIGSFSLGISVILYLCLYVGAPNIEQYFNIPDLTLIIRLLSLTFIISAIGLVPKTILVRNLRFGTLCLITIMGALGASLVSIIMAISNLGVFSLVAFQLVNVLVTTIIALGVTRYSVSLYFSLKSFKRLISFGLFTTITSVIDTIYENLLTTLIGKYINVAQAGYLFQAKRLEEAMTTSVALTITNVSFPIMTKLKEDISQFKVEAISLMRTVVLLIFPLLFTVILFSELLVTFILGKEWLPAAFYLSVLMWAGMILIIESLLRSFIKSLCAVKELMYITLFKRALGIFIIVSTLIITPRLAIYGYVISCFIGLLANIYIYSVVIKTSIIVIWGTIIKIVIPAALYFIVAKLLCGMLDETFQYALSCILLLGIYYAIVTCFLYKNRNVAK